MTISPIWPNFGPILIFFLEKIPRSQNNINWQKICCVSIVHLYTTAAIVHIYYFIIFWIW